MMFQTKIKENKIMYAVFFSSIEKHVFEGYNTKLFCIWKEETNINFILNNGIGYNKI